jgi:cytochrome c oxidase subunit 4
VERASPRRRAALSLLALLGLAGVSWALALAPMGWLGGPIALSIAAVKAGLVGLFFMELVDARASVRLVAIVAPLFVALLLGFALADVLTR